MSSLTEHSLEDPPASASCWRWPRGRDAADDARDLAALYRDGTPEPAAFARFIRRCGGAAGVGLAAGESDQVRDCGGVHDARLLLTALAQPMARVANPGAGGWPGLTAQQRLRCGTNWLILLQCGSEARGLNRHVDPAFRLLITLLAWDLAWWHRRWLRRSRVARGLVDLGWIAPQHMTRLAQRTVVHLETAA